MHDNQPTSEHNEKQLETCLPWDDDWDDDDEADPWDDAWDGDDD